MRTRTAVALLSAVLVSLAPTAANASGGRPERCAWTQWGQGAAYAALNCVSGQHGLRLLDQFTVDPFAAPEAAENSGALAVNYPAPLLDGEGDVFMLQKAGRYVSCDPPGSGHSCGDSRLGQPQRPIVHSGEWCGQLSDYHEAQRRTWADVNGLCRQRAVCVRVSHRRLQVAWGSRGSAIPTAGRQPQRRPV